MKRFVKFNKNTGVVISWGTCPTRDFGRYLESNEEMGEVEEHVKDLDIYFEVKEGRLKPKSSAPSNLKEIESFKPPINKTEI